MTHIANFEMRELAIQEDGFIQLEQDYLRTPC